MSWQEDSALPSTYIFIMELSQFSDISHSRLSNPPSSDSAPIWLPRQTILQQKEYSHLLLQDSGPSGTLFQPQFINCLLAQVSASPTFSYNKSGPILSLLKLVCNQKSFFHWKSGRNSIGVKVRKNGVNLGFDTNQPSLSYYISQASVSSAICGYNSDSSSLSCYEDKNLHVITLINYSS